MEPKKSRSIVFLYSPRIWQLFGKLLRCGMTFEVQNLSLGTKIAQLLWQSERTCSTLLTIAIKIIPQGGDLGGLGEIWATQLTPESRNWSPLSVWELLVTLAPLMYISFGESLR